VATSIVKKIKIKGFDIKSIEKYRRAKIKTKTNMGRQKIKSNIFCSFIKS
jgi:hypothetical protein